MNLFAHSIRSKGRLAFARRVGTIAWRFGLTAAKTQHSLEAYLQMLHRHGVNATFPITALILQRHRDLVQRFAAEGVEFAVHGYAHTDHALLTFDDQHDQLARALSSFHAAGLAPEGFRAPYLRCNEDTILAVESLGFRYSSNDVVVYDVLDLDRLDSLRQSGYRKALDLYSATPATLSLVRPRLEGDLVELPVAMPDDEILIDRLGYHDGASLGQVWLEVLDQTHEQGDLLTLQLHPERGALCLQGLDMLLTSARKRSPAVWIAQMRDIASWWRRRRSFELSIDRIGEGQWLIVAPEDTEATVLLRHVETPNAQPWHGSYARLEGSSAVVDASVRPAIGVSPASFGLQQFLSEEGYAIEIGHNDGSCSLYFDRPGPLSVAAQLAVLEEIEQSNAPLVRLGRWPSGARSAMSITGDIDAFTLLDFVLRTWEVR